MNIELDEVVVLIASDDTLELAAHSAPTYTAPTSGWMYVCPK